MFFTWSRKQLPDSAREVPAPPALKEAQIIVLMYVFGSVWEIDVERKPSQRNVIFMHPIYRVALFLSCWLSH